MALANPTLLQNTVFNPQHFSISVKPRALKGRRTGNLPAPQLAKNEFRLWSRCRHLPQVAAGLCCCPEPAATSGAGNVAFGRWEAADTGQYRSKQAGIRLARLKKWNTAFRGLDEPA